MKSFFILVVKQIFALIIAGFIVLGLFVVLILGLIGAFERAPVYVPKNSVLVIDLGMHITDAEGEKEIGDYLQDIVQSGEGVTAYLLEVLDAIDAAAKDPRIVGIFLKGGALLQGSGYAVLGEVREALEAFKKSGKEIVSYLTQANVRDYFLGSVADAVMLNPLGQLDFKGLAIEMAYFGKAFEKYGIGVQVTKAGKYKSAVEPFVLDHMSDLEKEQMTALLNDIWEGVLKMISESRGIDKDELKGLSEKKGLLLAGEAKERKLVDSVGYEDEAFGVFKMEGVKDSDIASHKISLKKYIRDIEDNKRLRKMVGHKAKIGVVYVEGEITEGEGGAFNAGADRLERRLREISNDESVKAVVLRVNSPGGGAEASEKILHAVKLLQLKKPVVASFGSYAASGGYWVASSSNAIFTDSMSITGSIGVFGLFPNIEHLANNFGVNFNEVSTGEFGNIYSFFKPRTKVELAKLQDYTDLIYQMFLERVAKGRKLELEAVEKVAEGRVWSGLQAKELGLADFYGGLKDAVAYAAELAKLSEGWEVFQYPRKRGLGYDLFEFLKDSQEDAHGTGVVVRSMLVKYLKFIEKSIEDLSQWNDPNAVYARMPGFVF